jgi:hypothetical protein
MRTAENPLAGNKHHSDNPFDMDKLPLDEMIDRLINSDELSLTLTATPQLAEKVWYLMENTCIRAFTAGDLQAKKSALGALFQLYQTWLAEPLSMAAKNQFHPCSPGSGITSSPNGCGRKRNTWFAINRFSTPGILLQNCVSCVRCTRPHITLCLTFSQHQLPQHK